MLKRAASNICINEEEHNNALMDLKKQNFILGEMINYGEKVINA